MQNEARISIRQIERIDKLTAAGDKLLAKFDVGIGGIDMLGCALIEARDGHQAVIPPGRKRQDGKRPIFISDVDLRDRLLRLVRLKLSQPPEEDEEPEDAGLRRVLGADEADSLAMAGIDA